jgi:hypothetical protein
VGVEPSQGETPGSVTFLAVAFPGSEGYCSEVNVTTIAAAVPNTFSQVKSPGNTVYYLDGEKGDDSSPGTAEDKPWKSLARLNSVVLTAGDKVLFKAGSAYAGCLKLQGSGKEGAPIIVDKYGEGPSPRINAKGKSPESLLLHNVEYYEVQNLELTNLGKQRAHGRAGVRLRVDNFGTAHHIHLKKLYVHDVHGDLNTGDGDQFGGFGLQWVNKGRPRRSDPGHRQVRWHMAVELRQHPVAVQRGQPHGRQPGRPGIRFRLQLQQYRLPVQLQPRQRRRLHARLQRRRPAHAQ